jgi:hypothetical protein
MMIIGLMLFYICCSRVFYKAVMRASISFISDMLELNLCGSQSIIVTLQYKKRFTIWELGKNKFT